MASRKKISPRQREVLQDLASSYTGVLYRPVHTLELLQKKGLVAGNKQRGWRLTKEGHACNFRCASEG